VPPLGGGASLAPPHLAARPRAAARRRARRRPRPAGWHRCRGRPPTADSTAATNPPPPSLPRAAAPAAAPPAGFDSVSAATPRRHSDARGGTAPVACPRGAGRRLRRGGCVVFTPASEVTAITNKSRGLHPAAAAATVPPNAGTASWRTAVRGRTPASTLGCTEVGVKHWVKGASGLTGSTVASMLREG